MRIKIGCSLILFMVLYIYEATAASSNIKKLKPHPPPEHNYWTRTHMKYLKANCLFTGACLRTGAMTLLSLIEARQLHILMINNGLETMEPYMQILNNVKKHDETTAEKRLNQLEDRLLPIKKRRSIYSEFLGKGSLKKSGTSLQPEHLLKHLHIPTKPNIVSESLNNSNSGHSLI